MRKLIMAAGAGILLAGTGAWLIARGEAPAAEGVVLVQPRASSAQPMPAPLPGPIAQMPSGAALPETLLAQVRQAYPLLTDVDLTCDAAGCAVTATIPPPTDDAFLAKRQEMLTGGLAQVIAANGYQPSGPVQMDEVAFNVFHIRAALERAR